MSVITPSAVPPSRAVSQSTQSPSLIQYRWWTGAYAINPPEPLLADNLPCPSLWVAPAGAARVSVATPMAAAKQRLFWITTEEYLHLRVDPEQCRIIGMTRRTRPSA